jgi:hypothetical protein
MKYWCYILTRWELDILKKISKKMVVTIPNKYRIDINDTIFFYNKKNPFGFLGYAITNDAIVLNIKKNNEYIYEIFIDKTFNNYYVELNDVNFINVPINKKNIFCDNKDFIFEFKKCLRIKEEIVQLSNELGIKIKKFIKMYQKYSEDNENEKKIIDKSKIQHKKTTGKKKKLIKKENEKNNIPEVKSKFLIPIMIIPCKILKNYVGKLENIKKSRAIIKHIKECKKCDLTNNNDRISLDILPKDMLYYEMTNKEELVTLLKIYHSLEYYDTKRFRIIEILNKKKYYNNCFCIIGRMEKEY